MLSTVEGLKIKLLSLPEQVKDPPPFAMSYKKKMILTEEIAKLVDKGVLENTNSSSGQFVSNVFLVLKPNNKHRMILDLSSFNDLVDWKHFKMFNLETALDLTQQGFFMASIDLSDAYYSMAIHPSSRKYLRFKWNDQLFQYTCLPNGISSAPRDFTKLLQPIFSHVRSLGSTCFSYIDDSFIVEPSYSECLTTVKTLIYYLEHCGFFIHPEKSILQPTTSLVFLGFQINSEKMVVSLTNKKKQNLYDLCVSCLEQGAALTIRKVASLVGIMNSYAPGTTYGGNYIKRLELDKNASLSVNNGNFDASCYISLEGKLDITWWRDNVFTSYREFMFRPFTGIVTCDASNLGWGAHFKDLAWNGRWKEDELLLHINVLELYAIYFALKCLLCPKYIHSYFNIRTDNTTAVAYINKNGGTKSRECAKVAFKIWRILEHYNCYAFASHIPGTHNVLADLYSRKFKDNIEWALSDEIFRHITKEWGTPTIDLFASRVNAKCSVYAAWQPDPEASFLDAFSLSWTFEFMYLFPPFCLISRVWSKIMKEGSHVILICPDWPGQPWYSAVQRTAKRHLFFPKKKHNLVHPSVEMQNDPIQYTQLVAFLFC